MRTWLRSPFTRRAYEHSTLKGRGATAHMCGAVRAGSHRMYRAAGRQRGGAGARARIPHARRPILRGNPPPQLTPPARLRTAPRLLAATRPQARRSGSPPEPGRHGRRPKGAPASRRAASWAPRPRPRSARPGRAPSAAPCTARPRRCSSRCARCGRGHQAVSAACVVHAPGATTACVSRLGAPGVCDAAQQAGRRTGAHEHAGQPGAWRRGC